jgi:hypothetical protein
MEDFCCGLFHDAVSISDNIALNGRLSWNQPVQNGKHVKLDMYYTNETERAQMSNLPERFLPVRRLVYTTRNVMHAPEYFSLLSMPFMHQR